MFSTVGYVMNLLNVGRLMYSTGGFLRVVVDGVPSEAGMQQRRVGNVSAYVYSRAVLRMQEYMQFQKLVHGQGVRVLCYGMYRSMRCMGSCHS